MARVTAESHCLPFTRNSVDSSFRSDRGRVRPTNEDCARVVIPEDPAILESKGVLMVVADGMGGHQGGEVASQITVDRLCRAYYEDDGDPQKVLREALEKANHEVHEFARVHPQLAGMGTTCTALAVVNGSAWLAHVGDTRLYLVRDGTAYRMTQDDSATADLVKRGLMTLDEADHHEERNVILRAVGTQDHVEATTWKDSFPVRPGDRLLLCSDGFHGAVTDEEMGRLCSEYHTSAEACQALLNLALERDGSDNITIAVMYVGLH